MIESRIREPGGWRSKTLSELRVLIKKADPSMVEEVKWRKPSSPLGVLVWSHDGIVCTGGILKYTVRLTFLKGAFLRDPKKAFNASLEGKALRAIDFHEGDIVDEAALKGFVLEAVALNKSKNLHRRALSGRSISMNRAFLTDELLAWLVPNALL